MELPNSYLTAGDYDHSTRNIELMDQAMGEIGARRWV